MAIELGGAELRAGTLRVYERRGQATTFQYAEEYLVHPRAYAIDPALPLSRGVFQPPPGKVLFNCFSDVSPDRWGQNLMRRAERDRARASRSVPRTLGLVDFLVGVHDDLRQGALRLRSPAGEYLSDARAGVPGIVSLGSLLHASENLDDDPQSDVPQSDVRDLIAAGSSLGGTRPKAAVLTGRGTLALAKFPRPATDDWDVTGWEKVENELARRAGMTAARAELLTVAGQHVLVVERFDRDGARRIGYASALTLLESSDMDRRSYLEIADAIERNANTAGRDLTELFRRMVFSILTSNTDDHLRNHGFLRRGSGWDLSPAFDMNPNPETTDHLTTAITLDDATADIDLAMEVAPLFRLNQAEARGIVGEVEVGTRSWADVATQVGVPGRDLALMEPAFEGERRIKARRAGAAFFRT